MNEQVSLEELVRRLEVLERQNRVARALAVALVLGVVLVATLGQAAVGVTAQETGRVVEAERFVVTDKAGAPRGELSLSEDGPQLTLYGEGHQPRVQVWVGKDDAGITLWNNAQPVLTIAIPASELSERDLYLSSPYVPSQAEWNELRMTATLNSDFFALTDKLKKTALWATYYAAPIEDGIKLELMVNTECQPGWAWHTGLGRFSVSDREVRAAYSEAGELLVNLVSLDLWFPLTRKEIAVKFYVNGYEVGTYRNGVMKLKGE